MINQEKCLRDLYLDAIYIHLIHEGYNPMKAKQMIYKIINN